MSRSQVIKTLAEITSLLDQEDLSMVGGAKPKNKKGGCSACGGCGSCGGAVVVPYGQFNPGMFAGAGVYGGAPSTNIYKPGYPNSSRRSRSVAGKKNKSGGASKNPWIMFLKQMERQTGRSYAELVSDPNVSAAYHSQYGQ